MLFISHTMEDLTFLVPTRPAVCARALRVFLVVCVCFLFLNAGRSSQNSSQRVLIVFDPSCGGNGCESEARATPVDGLKPGIQICLNPGVAPPPTPAGPVKRDWYTLMGPFAVATPTCMGDHESQEAGKAPVEEELKWRWLR